MIFVRYLALMIDGNRCLIFLQALKRFLVIKLVYEKEELCLQELYF